MNMNPKKIRVLVVDDSALMRKLIPQILEADPSIEVVGTAMDGNFCLKKIEELQPNVVTLDLEMPGMNGIDTLKEIMRWHPVPVIVVSSHSTEGASVTLKALGLGAFDFVTKPHDASAHMAETATELIAKIHAAAECKVVRPGILRGTSAPEKLSAAKAAPPPSKLVAIGISTGGPQALEFVLAQLPPDFPGSDRGRATHARGLYRHVCAPPGRVVFAARKRSPIGRHAAGRARADLPRKPAYESEAARHGRPGGAE